MKTIAVDFFRQKKGNCAQAIIYAWALYKNSEAPESKITEYSSYGRGKAPGGICGAVYSVLHVTPDSNMHEIVINEFAKKTNGLTVCSEIRGSGCVSCIECISIAAEILERILIKQNNEYKERL